jgi:ornithine carbamoyltransferase
VPKDFVSLADWSAAELSAMLARAAELKQLNRRGERPQTLEGRSLAMFFEKPSLRTHVTFEAGMTQLGGHAIWLRPEQVGIGTRESAADVASNLSRWVDALVARTYSHHLVEELASVATIPVINGLTDLLHPCQVMADLQTIAERRPLAQSAIAYVGDGNNMATSLAHAAAMLGAHMHIASPEAYQLPHAVVQQATTRARHGARLRLFADAADAVRGADVVYTDTWTSMGQEAEADVRRVVFAPYQVNEELMAHAKPGALFMHCLPAHRGEEVTTEVFESEASVVFDQAENRLHGQKALLLMLLAPTAMI